MKVGFTKVAAGIVRTVPPWVSLTATVLAVALVSIACGGTITIFQDDFQGHAVGTNPGSPPIGQPWQISEVAPGGIDVAADRLDSADHVLLFGPYRNTAVVPFSALDRQRIASARNATVSFDYFGESSAGYSNYFDVAAYCAEGSDPAFLIRFSPRENPGSGGLHDVLYLDPAGGLVDTGLDVLAGAPQSVTIAADFAAETYQLDVQGISTTLPLFLCPSEIAEVQFSNYGVLMGSGSIDNVLISVTQREGQAAMLVPEMVTIWLLATGGLVCLGAWLVAMWKAK